VIFLFFSLKINKIRKKHCRFAAKKRGGKNCGFAARKKKNQLKPKRKKKNQTLESN